MALIETSDAGPPSNLALVGVGGQSNGVGKADPITSAELEAGEQSYLYTLGGRWMTPAKDPMHSTSQAYGGTAFPDIWEADMDAGVGPARTFAQAWMADNPDICVGIVPLAKSATSITEHLPGEPLYVAGRRRLNQAKRYGQLWVMLWVQGEQDTTDESAANNWRANFARIVRAWRNHHGEQLLVVLVQLGTKTGNRPYWDLVKQRQELAARTVPNVVLVKTDGLEKVGLHYVRAAQEEIGRRAYAVVKRRLPQSLTCEDAE